MNAWVLGLAVSALYLMNKNTAIAGRLHHSIAEFQAGGNGVNEATDGVTTAEVRKTYRRTDDITYADINPEAPAQMREGLVSAQKRAAAEVQAFDSSESSGPIVGVMMQFGV